MNKLLVICGATASGKTALAVECAKKLNSEVISADSQLVYKKLN
ncbi:MAG: tRNA (adenosine(37)-N6)-dimethylallyltransferase MiaA, partial [Clostridia bacterium]|nr:tRNA (adenosine(37)-N6)-dimethylallyltransferase MiaA [Clostridia bacterium]